jgi:hypothetical protein
MSCMWEVFDLLRTGRVVNNFIFVSHLQMTKLTQNMCFKLYNSKMVASSDTIHCWSQIQDMNFLKWYLYGNGAVCYIRSVLVCTSFNVWLHLTSSVPYWNSFDESIIKCIFGLHWCSKPVDHIQLAHGVMYASPQVVIQYYILLRQKSTVVIKLEDVLCPFSD